MWITGPPVQGANNTTLFSPKSSHILCLFTSCLQYVDKLPLSLAGLTKWLVPVIFVTLQVVQTAAVEGGEHFPFNYVSAATDRSILEAEQLVMERRYGEALSVFDEMEKRESQWLLPATGRLIIILVQFLEKDAPKITLERDFRAEVIRNRSRLEALEGRDDLTPWEHFLVGGTLGAQGLFDLEHGHYFRAFARGLKALSHFKAVQRGDPEIKDIHFAFGLYKYYRSVKTRYLWFLPLVRDQRKEGMAEIRLALSQGHYAVPGCKIALVLLAKKEGNDREGIALGKKYLLEYPRCKLIDDAVSSMERRLETVTGIGRDIAPWEIGSRGATGNSFPLLPAGLCCILDFKKWRLYSDPVFSRPSGTRF